MDNSSGVGVIDKTVAIMNALAAGPLSLNDLATATGLPRPTAHRLAIALEVHRFVDRDAEGRFQVGPRIGELATASGVNPLLHAAQLILPQVRERTGESVSLFQRQGDRRLCIAAAERLSGLRDTVPVGAVLTMSAGSAAQVLLAWDEPERVTRGLRHAAFNASTLSTVRRRGWAVSVGEREPGVASVSAPVRAADGRVVAALSISGPIERLTRQPGRLHAATVLEAAAALSRALV